MSTKEQRRKLANKKKREKDKEKRIEKRLASYPRPQFSVGNLFQVGEYVMDYDWDDLPIGGWVGRITKVHREADGAQYDVSWSDETMAKCHPIYEKLAKLEGLDFGKYTKLYEVDIHAFAGGEVILVDPDSDVVSHYTDRPLDPDDKNDRIRMIFDTSPLEHFPMQEYGKSEEDNDRLLQRFYAHLSEHLVLPFKATCVYRKRHRIVSSHAFTVKALIHPDVIKAESKKTEDWDGIDELYCTGLDSNGHLREEPLRRIVCENMPHKQLLDDYRTWAGDLSSLFENWHFDDDE